MTVRLRGGFLLFSDGFRRDLAMLLAVSIIIGALLSAGVAWAVNNYFGDTLAGLIGESGQYDFILHVRSEVKEPAKKQIASILAGRFPGARMKEGLTLAGKANFFVSLPDSFRNRDVLEHIDTYFGGLPGGSGYTIMVEPSVIVRGVQDGAQSMLVDKLQELSGVRFAFINGPNIVVVLRSPERAAEVSRTAQRLLDRYQVVEVRFPIGYAPPAPKEQGERVVQSLKERLNPAVAIDITMAQKDDDLQSLSRTLLEMKRFLLSYASEVTVKVPAKSRIQPGEQLVLAINPKAGAQIARDEILVQVLEAGGEKVRGIIVQGSFKGDPSQAGKALTAYRVVGGNQVGPALGPARVSNERYQLVAAIDESVKLLRELDKLSREADDTAARVAGTLDAYEATLGQMNQVEKTLGEVNAGLPQPLASLGKVDITKISAMLDKASAGIDRLKKQVGMITVSGERLWKLNQDLQQLEQQLDLQLALTPPDSKLHQNLATLKNGLDQLQFQSRERARGVEGVVNQFNPVAGVLLDWQGKIDQLNARLHNFNALAKDAGAAKQFLRQMQDVTGQALGVMRKVDTMALRKDLGDVTTRLQAMRKIDVKEIITQMDQVKSSLPALPDEDIGRSVRLIDRYIDGQVIPGDRIQILLDKGVALKAAEPVIKGALDTDGVTIFTLPAGTVQPDIRGQVFGVLSQVRATIAALVAVVFTLFVLLFDHTTIISAMRYLERSGSRRRIPGVDPASAYGALVGSLLLATIFTLSGARVPVLGQPFALLLGGALGISAAALAKRISPVNEEEVQAGESLGLSYMQVMREIVIPAARPGLLALFNRRRQVFH